MRTLLAVLAVAVAPKPPVIHEVFTPLPCPMHPVSTADQEGCQEKVILATDRTINARARAIFELLIPSARASFVTGERAWLRYRQQNCEADSSKFAGGTLAGVEFAGCVIARNKTHLLDLAGTLALLKSH
jgi:uncharacterized protein YecT (DUF1311 family)